MFSGRCLCCRLHEHSISRPMRCVQVRVFFCFLFVCFFFVCFLFVYFLGGFFVVVYWLQWEKTFSNNLASSVMDSNYLLFVLFSINVLFQLNEIFMLLCCLLIIFSFYIHVCITIELISNVFLWTFGHGCGSVGWLAMAYISIMQTLDLVWRTCQKWWMIGCITR